MNFDDFDKAKEKVDILQKIWNEKGPVLLESTCKLTGKNFTRNEITATLTTSKFIPISHPLILNIRKLVNSDENTQNKFITFFPQIVFHELLHIFLVDQNFNPWPTPALKPFENEYRTVINHLHLMSLEKEVYLHLKQNEILEKTQLWYYSLNENYKKAAELTESKNLRNILISEIAK